MTIKVALIKSDFSMLNAGFAREIELEKWSYVDAETFLVQQGLIKAETPVLWNTCKAGTYKQILGEVTIKRGERIQFLFICSK